MSTFGIVVIVVVLVLLVLFVGGFLSARRRAMTDEIDMRERVVVADRALEAARAADRGWDTELLHQAARSALERERPDFDYRELQLVLVDDRPGTEEDRAELAAVGEHAVVRVVVARHGDQWIAQSVT